MNKRTDATQASKIPTEEEIREEFEKLLKEKYGDNIKVVKHEVSRDDGKKEDSSKDTNKIKLDFELKPKDIKAYLDRYVIEQDEAKKALAIAVCDHYNHAMQCEKEPELRDEEYNKQNVIMFGPTGVGKTYLIRTLAKLIGVPFVKADATKFSETGYVGGNVEDLIRDLVHQADGNIELAQYGIVYLDEIDKVATPRNIIGRDVSGRGVQMGLLKLMEETEVELSPSNDINAQFQAAMEFQKKGKVERKVVNTRNILFIVSGAFNNLAEIIKRRLNKHGIGFGAEISSPDEKEEYLSEVTSNDLIKFGFEPEFIGRLPVHVVCHELDVNALYKILKYSEGSIANQYKRSFEAYGIDLMFSDEGLRKIAEKGYEERTGARGLFTVCERIFRELKYELPSTDIKKFVATADLVENAHQELQRLIKSPEYGQKLVMNEEIIRYEADFYNQNEMKIKFDEQARESICNKAKERQVPVKQVCDELLSSYEYGLKLIKQNTGRDEFAISLEVVENPDETLERWVRESYAERSKDKK